MSYPNAEELIHRLNEQDESSSIEAKRTSNSIHRSVLETVCAFANEPNLGGGYLLLGVSKDENSLFPAYTATGVNNPDKLQSDLATQCNTMFNIPIRPEIFVEQINEVNVLKVKVNELPKEQKPAYFKTKGLPEGAYRRIGSTDHRCTEDDMRVFYESAGSYDATMIEGSSFEDIDESALKRYRTLRERVNAAAEELSYSDKELLIALGCMSPQGNKPLTLAGLVLFGSNMAQRRLLPMVRIDYIRVPGNEWVKNPDERFTSIDMRGPLLLLVFRLVEAINADLPKGFLLEEGELQAATAGLPVKALREAIVNALMHRSYRENRPIQVIRYDNRLEIINPGYSLKPEDRLGEPGSETRNPYLAAVFHETNLAETKGTGIRAMRRLLEQAHLAPPTFESNRETNSFHTRLLLHHFLSESDLEWLKRFNHYKLTDAQKQALIFVREAGAIDNSTYRQLSHSDTLKASQELRMLRDAHLLLPKGSGRGTYYVPGINLLNIHIDPATGLIDPLATLSDPVMAHIGGSVSDEVTQLPEELQASVNALGRRAGDKEAIKEVIVNLCRWKPMSVNRLSEILDRNEKYLLNNFVRPLREEERLEYTIPEMPNHPKQAYKVPTK